MSLPQNPLDNAPSTSYRHLLVAFKYAEDAFSFENINPERYSIGQSIDGVGRNVVVVNEFSNLGYTINEAIWDFNFIPDIDVSTSSSVGKIVVSDQYVPYGFVDFLNTQVLATLNSNNDTNNTDVAPSQLMSLSHATFMLKTYFITGAEEGGNPGEDLIQTNPFFFNLDTVESVPSKSNMVPSNHVLHCIGASNSLGLLRSFSSIYQMNITHKDGNIHDQAPVGTGVSGGLRTRSSENASNRAARKTRLDLSKPMTTLKDVFDGLEADLNQQRYTHKGELQLWRREIRDDSVDKIIVAPQQTKQPQPSELPVVFNIDLDPTYNSYAIDNRNMPFEQPDIQQGNVGIRVFPVRPGATICQMVNKIMLLSKEVGIDAESVPKKTHKTSVTAIRRPDRYEINIKIRRYTLPSNNVDINTGPDLNINPLTFYLNDPEERDTDIVSLKSILSYEVGDTMLEKPNNDSLDAGVVYADREQATAERRPDLPFYQTLYSGIRPMIASYGIDGLEDAKRAGDVFNMMDRYTYTQTTEYEMIIRGNPLLMSDINRNPQEVVDDIHDSANYYQLPENNPMYARLIIYLASYGTLEDSNDFPERYYFDDYYHVTRVVNVFGGGKTAKRSFYQNLLLRRSDVTI